MALAPFRDINRRLANRSIRVMISPTPSTFAERRSILQVLKNYGHIDMFRRENYNANRYITITRNEDTAKSLTFLSPIACRISLPEVEPTKRARHFQSQTEPLAQPKVEFKTQTDRATQQDAPKPGGNFETREFVLTIGPARDYDHTHAAIKATEYSSWPEGYKTEKSFAVTALRDALPDTLLKKGLCHWNIRPEPAGARDGMRQRLERKQQIPGQMVAANAVAPPMPSKQPTLGQMATAGAVSPKSSKRKWTHRGANKPAWGKRKPHGQNAERSKSI